MARQMKDSGIEWIGQIPEEWHVSKIKNVYIVILGKMLSPSQTQKDQTLENYLCAANIKWSGVDTSIQKQMWFSESDKAEYKLHEGDILIMEGGLAGTSCKYRGEMAPCFIQNSVHCCRAKSNYSNQFLYYWMNVVYNSKYIENICNKATIQHYTKEKVMNTPFLICSSLEQEKIVSYLDRKCAQIDAIISKQQQIIEKLKEYKLSVITEAVTKGLDPNVPMKDSGVKWIGKIPEHWNILKLQAHTRMLTPMRDRPEKLDGDIPWVRIEDYDGKYISTSKEGLGVSLETVNEMNLKIYPVGSILCTSSCDLGKCAIVTRELVSNQRFINIIPDLDTNSDYLYYLMLSNAKRLNHLSTGTIQANLSRKAFEHLMVQFPPFAEQKEIAEYLDKKCETVELSIRKKQELIDRLNLYKKSLIYETVTGKKEI